MRRKLAYSILILAFLFVFLVVTVTSGIVVSLISFGITVIFGLLVWAVNEVVFGEMK